MRRGERGKGGRDRRDTERQGQRGSGLETKRERVNGKYFSDMQIIRRIDAFARAHA